MERLARWILGLLLVTTVLLAFGSRWWTQTSANKQSVELRARLPETGGWSQNTLYATVGEPLHLRMTSDDVVHGFAVGQSGHPAVVLYPGHVSTTTLLFDQPGTYTFYCTRWCGANHWRMRGTIEVTGGAQIISEPALPRYVALEMDIDIPHPAEDVPDGVPLASRFAHQSDQLPAYALDTATYWSHSPALLWSRLRAEPALKSWPDFELWDSVAWVWEMQVSEHSLSIGEEIYAQECAACHDTSGRGDGVMSRDLHPFSYEHEGFGHSSMRPPDFSDPSHMLGAAPALLEGRILRGGMGTGMPLYGPIYTPEEIEALVSYLYTFVLNNPQPAADK